MPTDGTLALETLPRQKRHLLTSLSMFFSIGSVIAAFVALLVIPANSCRLPSPCDASKDNKGWKYLMLILSVIVRPFVNTTCKYTSYLHFALVIPRRCSCFLAVFYSSDSMNPLGFSYMQAERRRLPLH